MGCGMMQETPSSKIFNLSLPSCRRQGVLQPMTSRGDTSCRLWKAVLTAFQRLCPLCYVWNDIAVMSQVWWQRPRVNGPPSCDWPAHLNKDLLLMGGRRGKELKLARVTGWLYGCRMYDFAPECSPTLPGPRSVIRPRIPEILPLILRSCRREAKWLRESWNKSLTDFPSDQCRQRSYRNIIRGGGALNFLDDLDRRFLHEAIK